ncbi:hypothetical protein NPIL_377221 [Nephila pilipes]|uniref:Uncharacterized protein n=1 Tax=Nephila pilipes TaxID=299642 RepID=A0A8X6NMT1_NEPPI|nr:hypothetical protein NPIL_377221 [Nephila pilipes]
MKRFIKGGEISYVNLRDLNLEEAYQRVDMLDTEGACKGFCDQLEQLIYTYTRQNADSDLRMKLISETQHIIIRCARKANKLLSDELKYYLQHILENGNSLLSPFLPNFRLGIIKNQKRITEIWLRSLWHIRSQKNPRGRQIQRCQTMTPNPCTPLLPRSEVRTKMKFA